MDSLSTLAIGVIAVALLTLAVVAVRSHINSTNVAEKQLALQERQFRARILQQQKEAEAASRMQRQKEEAAFYAMIAKQVTVRENREREEKRQREQALVDMMRALSGDTTVYAPVRPEPAAQPGIPADTATEVAIESRIDGTFEGWSGNTIFKLQNGQIWQQSMYGYNYHYAYIPKVVIYKTTGGWNMKVEGVDQAVTVKRIK